VFKGKYNDSPINRLFIEPWVISILVYCSEIRCVADNMIVIANTWAGSIFYLKQTASQSRNTKFSNISTFVTLGCKTEMKYPRQKTFVINI